MTWIAWIHKKKSSKQEAKRKNLPNICETYIFIFHSNIVLTFSKKESTFYCHFSFFLHSSRRIVTVVIYNNNTSWRSTTLKKHCFLFFNKTFLSVFSYLSWNWQTKKKQQLANQWVKWNNEWNEWMTIAIIYMYDTST